MTRCMTRLLTLALCLVLCAFAWPTAANAFEPVDLTHPVSLTLLANDEGEPLNGVTFYLHRVADMNEYAQFELLSAYSAYSGDINKLETAAEWEAASAEMDEIAFNIAPAASCTTDDTGLAIFTDLKPGLYLVTGDPVEIIPWAYAFSPFLVSVPNRDADDVWVYDVLSDVKLEREPAVTSVEVVKIWSDKNYEKKRPNELTITLLCDGEEIDTAILNAENSWSHVFTNLPAAHEYTVREKIVPKNYKVSYDIVNGALVIVNTYQAPVTPEPDLPQTGQLWWPVPILAGLGMILFFTGWYMHRKWSQEHEEP